MNRIEATSLDAAACKWSMASLDYLDSKLETDLLSHVTPQERKRRQSPLSNIQHWQRVKLLAAINATFLSVHRSDTVVQIVSLGAGFCGAALSTLSEAVGSGRRVKVLEIDTSSVVEAKKDLIEKSVKNAGLLSPDVLAASYKLLPADLRSLVEVDKAVALSGLDTSLPTLITLECVLCYLQPNEVEAVLSWARRTFSRSTIVVYDPTGRLFPGDDYGEALEAAFSSQGAPLSCCVGDASKQALRLRRAGWPHVLALDVLKASQRWLPLEEREAAARREPFDEHASLAALQRHYCISIGSHCSRIINKLSARIHPPAIGESLDEMWRSVEASISLLDIRLTSLLATVPQELAPGIQISRLTSADCAGEVAEKVRSLFKEGLAEPSQKFPAVARFVRGVLQGDLADMAHYYCDNNEHISEEAAGKRGYMWLARSVRNEESSENDPDPFGELFGCAGVVFRGGGTAELRRMSVSPSARRKKIGKFLVDACIRSAVHDMKCNKLVLSTLNGMEDARAFYESLGFRVSGVRALGGGGLMAVDYEKVIGES